MANISLCWYLFNPERNFLWNRSANRILQFFHYPYFKSPSPACQCISKVIWVNHSLVIWYWIVRLEITEKKSPQIVWCFYFFTILEFILLSIMLVSNVLNHIKNYIYFLPTIFRTYSNSMKKFAELEIVDIFGVLVLSTVLTHLRL